MTQIAAIDDSDDSPSYPIIANRDLILIVLLAGALRALVCLLSDNVAGDADDRALIAGSWAAAPHFISTGIWLPLHFYATGLLTYVFGNPITAGKVLSFVTGTVTVVPLFRMAENLFNRQVAQLSGLYFAVFGSHIGMSSQVMSEAPFTLLAIWGLSEFLEQVHSNQPRWRGLLGSAVLIALAGGFRQEGWQLAGILTLYLILRPALRRYAAAFAAVALSSYVLWSVTQVRGGADALHPLVAVANAKRHEAMHIHYSLVGNILKWGWIVVQSPGPIVSVLCVSGLYLAFKQRLSSDLAWVTAFLLGPYVALSIIKTEWAPQSRYMMLSTILLLPYAAAATIQLVASRGYRLRLVTFVVLLLTVTSQNAAYHRRSRLGLPCEDYNANDVATWKWLAQHAESDSELVVEDVDWRAPSLIVHAGLSSPRSRIIFSFDDPSTLESYARPGGVPKLLVLHSPLSKWPFLEPLATHPVYQNSDYTILSLASDTVLTEVSPRAGRQDGANAQGSG